MKILHVIAQLPCKTGSGVYFSSVLQQLAGHGHTQGAVFAVQRDVRADVPGATCVFPVLFGEGGLPFAVPGMSDVMPYESTRYSDMTPPMVAAWQAAFTQQLVKAKQAFKPDAVVLHHLWMLTSLGAGLFDTEIKIGICHNTDLRQAVLNPALKKAHVQNLGRLDAVFALSDGQVRQITTTFGIPQNRIFTLGAGYNNSVFYPGNAKKPARPVRFLYAGKIAPSKGVYELIRAFLLLRQSTPDVCLSLVGTPDAANKKRLQCALQGHSGIHITNVKDQTALACLMRADHIFVLPSYFEGLGLVALEALACGMWAVATEIEGLQSLLGGAVNESGAICYVPLPGMRTVDEPHEEEKEAFVQRLAGAMAQQARKAREGRTFPPGVTAALQAHTWAHIAQAINTHIVALARFPHGGI